MTTKIDYGTIENDGGFDDDASFVACDCECGDGRLMVVAGKNLYGIICAHKNDDTPTPVYLTPEKLLELFATLFVGSGEN